MDRGLKSLETICLLFTLKAKYPERITLLRGEHESRQRGCVYGFLTECRIKTGDEDVWELINDVFAYLPLCAIIDNRV